MPIKIYKAVVTHMKFFEGIKNLNDLRKEYRRLAFLYHPDKGGDTAIMQAINDQYDRLSKKLINGNADFSDARKHYEQAVSEEIREMIDRIIFLKGVEIEVIGGWIWITGNTFPVRSTLKGLGFMFSHAKTAWYWHKGEYSKKSGKLLSMDQMREMFGSQKIETETENQLH
jgi:curved DNA-binding protein CbpA